MKDSEGYVYLICDPSNTTFKIGVTRDLKSQRLKKLQTGNSEELFISSYYKYKYPFRLEKLLHLRFHNKHEHGEWFKLTAEDIVQFKQTCDDLCKTIESLKDNPFIKLR